MQFDQVAIDFSKIKSPRYQKIWEPFMKKYQCDFICELGIFKGDDFMEIIRHKPKLAVAVDSWVDDGIESHNNGHCSQAEFDAQFEYFKDRVGDMEFVQIIKDYTTNAAKNFADNYFDFVYVDADHSYEGCLADLIAWYPKVKQGKFLVGHDYERRSGRRFGVYDAVNKFASDNSLELILFGHSNWAVIKK